MLQNLFRNESEFLNFTHIYKNKKFQEDSEFQKLKLR